jgi:predicted dehydrogenase
MKVLFAGLGSIGQRHLRNLRALVPGDLEVLAWRTRRLGTVVTDRLGVATGADLERDLGVRAFADLEAALAEGPQAVFVCNPSALHLGVAGPAVEAGADLFLEKPVSDRIDGVEALAAAVEARGVVAAVGCQLRFHPLLRRLRSLLHDGAIGQVVAARVQVGEYLPGWHPYEDYRQGYAARQDLGGGVVLTLIHELDYVYWLFGLPTHVYAVGGHLSRLELDVEDTASILLTHELDGRRVPVHVHMDYLQRPPARGCSVIGDGGRLELDLTAIPSLTLYGPDGAVRETQRLEHFERNQLFLDEMTDFLHAIAGRTRPAVPLREGVDGLRLALAVKASMAMGAVVALA